MTILPAPRVIKQAILKMDTTVMNREAIEKIMSTMLPTEEEKAKIQDAMQLNPGVPLASAEQFLYMLSQIPEILPRLQLWAFRLDFDTLEREVVEPLMDLKQCCVELQNNATLRYILSTLLAVGNCLNSANIQGFSLEYLSRVPEVKDTVYKHSLLYHVVNIILDQFPDSTDLYSEIGATTRCAKVEWEELADKLER